MAQFVPPYPYRLPASPSPWQRINLARRNLLAQFEEQAFECGFVASRLFARDFFLCNSPDAVQFAFSTHNDSFERKASGYRHTLKPLVGDGLFISDGQTWGIRRPIVASILHISRLSQFAPVMVDAACEMRERWAKLPEPAEIDALSEMAQLTADVISRALFGRQLGREHELQIVEGFSEYRRRISQVDVMDLMGLPDWIPRPHLPGVYRTVKRIQSVVDDIIASCRINRDREDVSVIGQLLEARDESGGPLDARAIRNEVLVLFMAGHETTASTLAWIWYILSQTPEVEARLHDELDAILAGRLPTLGDIPKLKYTRAILDEVMRLYPPVPLLQREALREEGFQEIRIRKGALIAVCPWLLHRHRQLWTKPDHFIPERFLPGGEEPVSKFAYVPFSIGPRICAGMAFALTEAVLCIATLAQTFKFHLKPGHRVHAVCRLTVRPGDTLPMRLTPRQAPLSQPA